MSVLGKARPWPKCEGSRRAEASQAGVVVESVNRGTVPRKRIVAPETRVGRTVPRAVIIRPAETEVVIKARVGRSKREPAAVAES